jgi:hypothetical protein
MAVLVLRDKAAEWDALASLSRSGSFGVSRVLKKSVI